MHFSGFSTKSRKRNAFLPDCEEKMLQKQIVTYLSRKKKILEASLRQSTRVDWYFHFRKNKSSYENSRSSMGYLGLIHQLVIFQVTGCNFLSFILYTFKVLLPIQWSSWIVNYFLLLLGISVRKPSMQKTGKAWLLRKKSYI